MSTDRVSVTRTIPAPADRIFAVLADPARHAEIDGSGTVTAARGGSRTLRSGSSSTTSLRVA